MHSQELLQADLAADDRLVFGARRRLQVIEWSGALWNPFDDASSASYPPLLLSLFTQPKKGNKFRHLLPGLP